MDEDQEMEKFGMDKDFEDGQWIDGEFYYAKRKQKRTQTRDDVVYGVFAGDSSDSDYEGLGSSKKRRKNRGLISKADFTKPVNFISTGTVMPGEDIEKKSEKELLDDEDVDKKPRGLGFDSVSSSRTNLDEDGNYINEEDDFLPTAFGKKIKEGAELRRERQKEKSSQANKSFKIERKDFNSGDLGAFEKHTKGIGMKLLEKMGYKGRGLGKNEQGITAPIEAKLRPKGSGLGVETKPVLKQKEENSVPRVVQATEAHVKEKLWSKKTRVKKVYITAEELLQKKHEENIDRVQKVFDMRGPQVRVLTNLENLNAEEVARENDIPMPELQHNIKLILDSVELDIQKIGRDLTNERETVASLQLEKSKIQSEKSKQEKQLENMREIIRVMERVEEESSLGTLTLESLAHSFLDVQQKYADDYKLCNLPCIACGYALPLFIRVFQGWDPLQNPTHGQEIVSRWRILLEEDSQNIFGTTSPYTQLIMEVVFPAVRICGTNTWRARDPEPMLRFLDSWERLLPPVVLQNILDAIIMPKIISAVNSWDPRLETMPIHSWIHPWLPLLGTKLEPCYQTIRDRLESVLHAWHPSDISAQYILSPWKNVFDAASWNKLMVRYIVPKLLTVMQEFQINPANQSLDQFIWVRNWATTIPIQHMIVIMEVFFTKWYAVLHQWLNSKPDLDQVGKWYMGWKNQLPDELLANEHIRARLFDGLQMMNAAAEGMKVEPPGLAEQIAYQKKVEERQFERAAAQARVQVSDGPEPTLKEIIERFAQDNGLPFIIKPGRMQDGLQVYGFGNVNIIIDSHNQKCFAQMESRWVLSSLEQLLDLHNRASLKRR
ncbi:OLC1v1007029C1 [Oldenlandia corymbosa var. corymbosa]|uniref:OLC1v1007029C1 n=1 Tax=Oldenlandia corymbosa var. corymbosa TaxID=529605 RepID=A0AAV1DKR1_OLDCO|nr:OLC1v1007029C1 [Oldenlandia corymbosa var. corymbosa]